MIFFILVAISYAISAIICCLVVKLVCLPYLKIQLYKFKYGDKVYPRFFPLIGFWVDTLDRSKNNAGDKMHLDYLKNDSEGTIRVKVSNFGDKYSFVFNDPELIKEISTTKLKYYKKRLDNILLTSELLEKGILLVSGEKWKHQRQLIAPLFHYSKIQDRIPTMISCANELISTFQCPIEQTQILKNLQKTTGDVVCCSFFGDTFRKIQINGHPITVELSSLIGEASQYSMQNLLTPIRFAILGHIAYEKTPKWLLTQREKQYFQRAENLKSIVREEMNERIKNYKVEDCNTDFMRYMVEAINDKTIEKDTVIHLFLTLFFAGMDTTAHVALITLYFLSLQSQDQELLRDEINQIFTTDEDINSENLAKMEKFNLFVREVLRIRSPIPDIIPRQATQDHYIGEFYIPKGSFININIMANHYNDEEYKNPEVFDMNRKIPQNAFSYIPFSTGPRNCIGQHMALTELKVIMIKILKKYKIVRNDKVPFNMVYSCIYGPQYDHLVNFIPLNQQ